MRRLALPFAPPSRSLFRRLLPSSAFSAAVVAGAMLVAPHAAAAPNLSAPSALDVLKPGQVGVPLRGEAFQRAIVSALRSAAWQTLDPTLGAAENLSIRQTKFGTKLVVRVTPIVDGAKVTGADRVLIYRDGRPENAAIHAPLHKLNAFTLAPERAVATASDVVTGSLFLDATVERLNGFVAKTWLASKDGIRAAYRVRVPTLDIRDLSDVWVDADTGAVLLVQPVAHFADDGETGHGGGVEPDGGVDTDGGTDVDGGVDTDAGTLDDAGVGDADAGVEDDAGVEGDAGVEDDAGIDEPAPPAPVFAEAYEWAPAPGDLSANYGTVELEGLLPAEVGGHLRGQWVETYNCCKEYVCKDGGDECPELEDQRCATPDDEDVLTGELALELPAELVPLPVQGDTLYARTVFCAELPRVKSRPADGDTPAGWYETPVDTPREQNQLQGLASEEDAFAEIQAYYATMSFFSNMRVTLDDPTWCLGGLSMQCEADGTATLDPETQKPIRPFHVATNVMIPNIDIAALATQLFNGKGQSPGDPLTVDDFMRLDNAVFLPALEDGIDGIPPELSALVAAFNRPYDSNLYFQGVNDFAYDGTIVFHEFTHAVVHSLAPGLLSQYRDSYGSHAQPGAMNEGWSDYFSSTYRDDPVIGVYGAAGIVGGETGLRNATNTKKCPDDINGRVHDDSEPWTGALWDIREAVLEDSGEDGVLLLDRALLSTLAESTNDETFTSQAERIIAELETVFDADMAETARTVFTDRGILNCVRVWDLATATEDSVDVNIKPVMSIAGPGEVGLSNVSPAVLQMRVEVPAGSTGFSMRWTESAGGAASQFTGGGEPPVLLVLVHESENPVEWRYEGDGSVATPYDSDTGERIDFDITADENKITLSGNDATFDVVLESDPCEARTFIAHILNPESATTLSNIDLVAFDAEGECETNEPDADGGVEPEADPPPADCGCDAIGGVGTGGDADAGGPVFALGAIGVLTAAFIRRRRRR